MPNVFIPYCGVYSQSPSGKSTSRPQRECISKLPHLHNKSDPKQYGRLLKGCICTLICVVWNSRCTNLIKAKSAVNDFTDRTVTNVQMKGHFGPTDTHRLFRIMVQTRSVFSSAKRWVCPDSLQLVTLRVTRYAIHTR